MAMPAQAAEVEASASVLSSYVWRGIEVNEDAVLQPAVDISGLNIGPVPVGINFWHNLDLGDNEGALETGEFSEVDLAITLGVPGVDGLSLGLIEYWFPNTGNEAGGARTAREVFVGYSMDDVILAPSVTAYFDVTDVDNNPDYYVSLAVSHGLGEVAGFAVELAASLGYAGDDFAVAYGGTDGGLFDVNVTASASKQLTDNVSVSGVITYVTSGDDDALTDAMNDTDVLGGVSAAVTF
jgi:hypothetical protein